MIIFSQWNLASSKLKKSEENSTGKNWKQRQHFSESGFVLRIAPPPLSRDKRIKMKKSKKSQKLLDFLITSCTKLLELYCDVTVAFSPILKETVVQTTTKQQNIKLE